MNGKGWFQEKQRHSLARKFGQAPPYKPKKPKKTKPKIRIPKPPKNIKPKQIPIVINFNVATDKAKITDDDVLATEKLVETKPKKKKKKTKKEKTKDFGLTGFAGLGEKTFEKETSFEKVFGFDKEVIGGNKKEKEESTELEGTIRGMKQEADEEEKKFPFAFDKTLEERAPLVEDITDRKKANDEGDIEITGNEILNTARIATGLGKDELKGEEQEDYERAYNRYADAVESGQVAEVDETPVGEKVVGRVTETGARVTSEVAPHILEKARSVAVAGGRRVAERLHAMGHHPETIQQTAQISEATSQEIVEDLARQGLLKKE